MFRFLLLLSYLTFTSATFHPRHLRSHLHSHPISSPSTSTSASRPCPGSAADAIQLPRDLGVHPDYDIDYFYWTGTLYAPDCTTVNITSPSIDPLRTPCLYHYSIIFGQITSVKLAMMWIQLNTDPDNIIIHTQHTTPFFVDTSIQPWNVNAYDYLSNPPQYNFKWTTINNTVDVGSVGAEYQMSVTTPSYSWDLTFIQQEPMFGYGDHGYVNLDNVTCTGSYYFALPHLQQTSGCMTFNHPNQPSTSFTTVGQSYFERQYRIQPGGANGTGEAHWDWLYASVGDYQYGLMCAVPTTSFCGITICSISGRVPCQYNVAAHMSYISTHTINEHDIPIKSYVHIDTTPPMRLLMEPRFLNVDDSDLYDQYVTVTNIDTQEIGMGYAEYIRGKVA